MASVGGVLVFRHGKWVEAGADPEERLRTQFSDLKYFYANMIDYARVLLCVICCWTMDTYPATTVLVLYVSVLLDWVDGPVARYYGQCSVFGSGVDWVADVLAQIVQVVMWSRLQASATPWLLLATSIELVTCVFDFGVTTTLRYPYPALTHEGWFFKVLEWTMPGGSYSNLGTFAWMAYPTFCSVCILELLWGGSTAPWLATLLAWSRLSLLPFSVLYIWCEAAYGAFVISAWTEAPRTAIPLALRAPLSTVGAALLLDLGLTEDVRASLLHAATAAPAQATLGSPQAGPSSGVSWAPSDSGLLFPLLAPLFGSRVVQVKATLYGHGHGRGAAQQKSTIVPGAADKDEKELQAILLLPLPAAGTAGVSSGTPPAYALRVQHVCMLRSAEDQQPTTRHARDKEAAAAMAVFKSSYSTQDEPVASPVVCASKRGGRGGRAGSASPRPPHSTASTTTTTSQVPASTQRPPVAVQLQTTLCSAWQPFVLLGGTSYEWQLLDAQSGLLVVEVRYAAL